MGIREDFDRILDGTRRNHGDDVDLLPTRLAIAAAGVLPVDGASISVAYGGYRVPLGASDATSAAAERLEFTAGDGPCMTAIEMGDVLSVSEPELRDRWPTLAESWLRQTGFRSAASQPLQRHGHTHAALNLFFAAPDGHQRLDHEDLTVVAEVMAEQLSAVLGPDLAIAPGSSAETRRRIWIAVGMTMNHLRLDAPDALDRLRAHAYTEDTTLDEFAGRLIEDPSGIVALDD